MLRSIRKDNTSKILKRIMKSPVSRVEIAEELGLTKTTVGEIVRILLEKGIVTEEKDSPRGVGRPTISLKITPDCAHVLGLEVTRDEIAICLMNASMSILIYETYPLPFQRDREGTLKIVYRGIDRAKNMLEKLGRKLSALTVAAPGPVDVEKGIIINPRNFPLSQIPLADLLKDKYGAEVWVENDADMGAVGEKWYTGRDDSFVWILTGKGIGSGIIINGELYRGENGYAGEIGYTRVFDGERYVFLEDVCGEDTVLKHVRSMGFESLAEAIESEDDRVREYLDSIAEFFSTGLLNLIHLFGISKVVIGGFFKEFGNDFLKNLKMKVERYLLYKHEVDISFSAVQEPVIAFGAAVHALENYLERVATS
ncbi:ROK family transcriptional regulator [Thermotoga neapolitana]|uniref:ROK family protein n=1 Tax=Thermotoga neapolitana (strain ATCC 49049 / DSM 4359 / NBRC 107923 / NS-E) TaxID=309803 RepID=B9K990_THENN|nr:ROK family transcriptional regulator [Thermotoga neapolitana]ACM23523.1 ROK family protein [Thermotoga neapolitana DSM 4359]KFZ21152.1 ROK family protein [Thermotoga neapolitana LA10]HBF10186.1 ROK family transcriptional regulator [Thermotoga neapolitana]